MSDSSLGSWTLSADLWRMSERLTERYVNNLFRTFGTHRLPYALLGRIYQFGVPPEIVAATLKSIRSLDQWSMEWVKTAQHFLGTSRRDVSAGNMLDAERARYQAAMCYHIAQILELYDVRTRDNCRAWTASLTRLSLPLCNPNARHLMVPWSDRQLPVLFQVPDQQEEPFGLVVFLNGVSQSKEETFRYAPRFLQAGYAVMAIDSPGTGEATALGPIDPAATDILDGVFTLLRNEQAIDLRRVALIGTSLGGNEAVRIARRHPNIMAMVAVTPAIQPARWMHRSSSILRAELKHIVADDVRESVARQFDAMEAAKTSPQPMLIYGAGRDLIVPPNESQRLAAAVGDRATYIWYPDLGHCLYEAVDQWTWEAATWIAAIGEATAEGVSAAPELAAIGKQALESVTYAPQATVERHDEEEDFTEYARLLPPERDSN